MFEVGFTELVLIAVVALIVLGPERLPKAARMAGTFMRKARNSFESLKHEVERELDAEDLKKRLAEIKAAPAALSEALSEPFLTTQNAFENGISDIGNVIANPESRPAPAQDILASSDPALDPIEGLHTPSSDEPPKTS